MLFENAMKHSSSRGLRKIPSPFVCYNEIRLQNFCVGLISSLTAQAGSPIQRNRRFVTAYDDLSCGGCVVNVGHSVRNQC